MSDTRDRGIRAVKEFLKNGFDIKNLPHYKFQLKNKTNSEEFTIKIYTSALSSESTNNRIKIIGNEEIDFFYIVLIDNEGEHILKLTMNDINDIINSGNGSNENGIIQIYASEKDKNGNDAWRAWVKKYMLTA